MGRPTFVSPAEGRVTSPYGARPPLNYHYGIDIAPPVPGTTGWPVYAAYGGRVRAAAVSSDPQRNPVTGTWNTGSYLVIDGNTGTEFYGHMETIDVRPGQLVQAGDCLGTMGARGNVTGIHLHFESWDAFHRSPHDPMIDFRRHGVQPGSRPNFSEATVNNSEHDKIARAVLGYRNPVHSNLDAWAIIRNTLKRAEQNQALLEKVATELAEVRRELDNR